MPAAYQRHYRSGIGDNKVPAQQKSV